MTHLGDVVFRHVCTHKAHIRAPRLRADARGRDGRVRQELAAGVPPMTNHDEEPAPLPALVWAVVFTILLVAAVAIFALVLFASGVTNHNRPRQALARPNSCVCDAGRATSYYSLTRRSDFRFRGRSGHHSAIVYQSRFMSTRLNQSPKPSRTELSHSRIGRASRSFQKRRWQVVAQFDCNKPFARAWALSARRT